MLRSGGDKKGVREWYDKLAPLVAGAQEQLKEVTPSRLVMRSGCTHMPEGAFRLPFFGRDYLIHPPEFTVRQADTGKEPSSFVKALLLTYLVTADGTTPSRRWVAFRELPNGMFYAQAFRGYAEERLACSLPEEDPVGALRRGAEGLGGVPVEIGDVGYAFEVLPRIHLAVVYWRGDEDLASRASILFEDTASHYMPTDGLAILGSQLTGQILKAARG